LTKTYNIIEYEHLIEKPYCFGFSHTGPYVFAKMQGVAVLSINTALTYTYEIDRQAIKMY